MHDCNGSRLKVGDVVHIPCIITSLGDTEGEGFCNVSAETVYGRRPDGHKESFSALNTAQVLLIESIPDAVPAAAA